MDFLVVMWSKSAPCDKQDGVSNLNFDKNYSFDENINFDKNIKIPHSPHLLPFGDWGEHSLLYRKQI